MVTSINKKRVIVIGNGMVGHKFIETLCDQKNSDIEILTFSEEPVLAYDRVQLSSYFSGESATDLSLASIKKYEEQGIKFHLNDKVISINKSEKTVVTEKGIEVCYDKLVIATGSTPFVPSIPGGKGEHIHVYRTLQDLEDIKSSAKVSSCGTVIGGGLLGLEAANALKQLSLKTSVVEFAPQLMPVQLDKEGGKLLRKKIKDINVDVLTEKNTKKITQGTAHRYRMEFTDGSQLETDTIVFSAGIRPQDELARSSDISIGERGGIIIDDYCQTSDKDIYSIGECALWNGKIYGLVAPGYQMAKTAAIHCAKTLSEEKVEKDTLPCFTGADMSTKLKLLGIDVASIGDAHGKQEGSKSYSFTDSKAQTYKKIVVSENGELLLGAVLVGGAEEYGSWLQLYLNEMQLPEYPQQLLFPYAADPDSTTTGVENLPDSAQICSCNDISKGEIASCIGKGIHDAGALKQVSNAGTGCGGCVQLVGQILDSELNKLGIEINNELCDHFSYSRAELFDIIKIKNIKILMNYWTSTAREVVVKYANQLSHQFWLHSGMIKYSTRPMSPCRTVMMHFLPIFRKMALIRLSREFPAVK